MRTHVVVILAVLAACKKTPSEPSSSGALPAAAASEIRYLALGDSFTIGTGSTPEQAFPSRLAERWRQKDAKRVVTLKNLGVNGFTTTDLTNEELPLVPSFHPTFVTLAIGANDRVAGIPNDVYRSHIRAILKAVVDAGVQPKSIVTLPQPDWSLSPAASSFGTPQQLGVDIVALNKVLQEESDAIGARYIDLFPLMHRQAEAKMLARDGLHPNAQAHDEWAAAIFEKVPAPQ